MPADILLYALIAAGLVFWLRNILGTRHGDERQRPNPFAPSPDKAAEQKSAHSTGPQGAGLLGEEAADMKDSLERHMSIENEQAEAGLMEIAKADRGFELSAFLNNAQDAFIIIVEAFAEGDKETLHSLLTPPLYNAFEKVIDERAEKGEQASVEIHAVRKTEVLDARIDDGYAYVTVRFIADETSILRDSDGDLVFGDPERITETIDIWTFGRKIKSRDPVWLLFETREDEEDEVSGSTVPESETKED